MMTKFYRVKKDNFLWKEGAILKEVRASNGAMGYQPIEDVWDVCAKQTDEYITSPIIEDPANAEYFERVYPDTLKGSIYRTKDQLISLYQTAFKE